MAPNRRLRSIGAPESRPDRMCERRQLQSTLARAIGKLPPRAQLLALAGVHLHVYGKQPRPGRKVGHCTAVEPTAAARDRRARRLLRELAVRVRIP